MTVANACRMKSIGFRGRLALAAIVAGSVGACAPESSYPGPAAGDRSSGGSSVEVTAAASIEATAQGPLRVALDIPVQLDPALASSDAEITILNAVYDYLVDIDANNAIQPRLAKSWSVAEDGLTYTFQLEDGARFHDGAPLSAGDVVWTFDRLRDPDSEYATADLYSNILGVSEVGPLEVAFTLRETNPFFLYDLSDNHAVILKAGTQEPGTTFNGTGPFVVEDYRPENRMTMSASGEYFIAGKPHVATVELIFFPDEAASVDALRGGQVDLVMRMPTPLFETLQAVDGIETQTVPTNGFNLVRLRADREPGNDPRVMSALRLATDREAILDTVAGGVGAIGRDSPIGPLYRAYYSEEAELPGRNVALARQLLAEAGHPDGLHLELHTPDTGDRPDLAAVLKEQWADAGVDVDIVVEPESVYYGENHWLDVDLGITGWGSRPVPQFYLDVMLACGAKWNEAKYCDDEVDTLISEAGSTTDDAARAEAYTELQRIMIERGPVIIPYFFVELGAISDEFADFTMKAFPGRTDLAAIRRR